MLFGQRGVLSPLDDLRLGRLRAAVGVVHDEPAVLGLGPLGPERHVVPRRDRRARRVALAAAVLFGVPAGELESGELRDVVRQGHVFVKERREV